MFGLIIERTRTDAERIVNEYLEDGWAIQNLSMSIDNEHYILAIYFVQSGEVDDLSKGKKKKD